MSSKINVYDDKSSDGSSQTVPQPAHRKRESHVDCAVNAPLVEMPRVDSSLSRQLKSVEKSSDRLLPSQETVEEAHVIHSQQELPQVDTVPPVEKVSKAHTDFTRNGVRHHEDRTCVTHVEVWLPPAEDPTIKSTEKQSGGEEQTFASRVLKCLFPPFSAEAVQHNGAIPGKPPVTLNWVERAAVHALNTDPTIVIELFASAVCAMLTLVSIFTSQIDINNNGCYTYWGYKLNCDSRSYTTPVALLSCDSLRVRLQAGSACALIALTLLLIQLSVAAIRTCTSRPPAKGAESKSGPPAHTIPSPPLAGGRIIRFVLGGFGFVVVVVQLIAWAVIANVYASPRCVDWPQGRSTAYGVGFGFSLTSWLINLVATIALVAVPADLLKCY